MMASFPKVKERVKKWEQEIKKSNYFIETLLRIAGTKVLSELPRKHTLTKVDTTKSFDRIAQTHKRKGFFLSNELLARKIIGEFAGATRQWKLNVYGLTWEQIRYLGDAFIDIARKYKLQVN
jgi:Sep-tRNA:Cys-tRNA synthetase